LKETTDYNHYIKRIERVFSNTIDKKFYNIHSLKHNSEINKIAAVVNEIKTRGCKIIFGGVSSTDSIKLVKILADKSILFITPTSSSIKIKEIHKKTIYMSLDDNHVVKSLVNKTKDLEGRFIVFRNLSYPNTNYIATQLFQKLKFLKRDIEIIDIISGVDIKLTKKQLMSDYFLIPTYEKDLINIHNAIKENKKRVMFGIDAWGTNLSVYKKFALNDKYFNSIKLDYWNHNTCSLPSFIETCNKYKKEFPKKGFDSFMAIAYDSAQYLNSIVKNEKKTEFMTFKNVIDRKIVKESHFYTITHKKYLYLETK